MFEKNDVTRAERFLDWFRKKAVYDLQYMQSYGGREAEPGDSANHGDVEDNFQTKGQDKNTQHTGGVWNLGSKLCPDKKRGDVVYRYRIPL